LTDLLNGNVVSAFERSDEQNVGGDVAHKAPWVSSTPGRFGSIAGVLEYWITRFRG
jgi:hypothetical protein